MARGIGISTLKPVIELLFNDGLENTGSGDYAIAPSENSDEIVYADGLNGKCYAATNHSQIVISDVAELLQNDYTIVFWTKIEDTGLDPYPQWRRITWWQVNGVYRGLELTYSSSTSTNAPYFVVDGNKNGLSTDSVINDGNWHSVSIVQRGGNITTTIDGIEQIIANNCVLMPASTELSLSSKNYSLNGYISSFRVYDRALSYAQIDQVLGLH